MTKISGVYWIRNKVTLKYYVGSSKDIYGRWSEHVSSLVSGEHHSILLQRSWDKHGVDAFEFEICLVTDLLVMEQAYIDDLNAADPKDGYNISPTAGSCEGIKRTEEQRKNISEAGLQWWRDAGDEYRKMWSEKMSKRDLTDEARMHLSHAWTILGMESKTKFTSDIVKALWRNEEYRARLLKHRRSDEERKKNSERIKALWADPVQREKYLEARRKRALDEKVKRNEGTGVPLDLCSDAMPVKRRA